MPMREVAVGTAGISTALQTLLRGLRLAKEPAPPSRPPAPAQRDPVLRLTDRMALVVMWLEALGDVAPELQSIRTDVQGRLTSSTALEPGAIVLLELRVDRLQETVVRAEPSLRLAYKLSQPGGQPSPTDPMVPSRAEAIRRQLVDAVTAAWQPASAGTAALEDAEAAMQAMARNMLLRHIAYQLPGIRAKIDNLETPNVTGAITRDGLVASRRANGRVLGGLPNAIPGRPGLLQALNDLVLVGATDDIWPLGDQLRAELDRVRSSWDMADASAPAATTALLGRLPVVWDTLAALTMDDQLESFLEHRTALDAHDPFIYPRLEPYRNRLESIFLQLHEGFADPHSRQFEAGARALSELTEDPQYRDDVATAARWLTFVARVEMIVLTAVVLAAAAYTGGLAASGAGLAISVLAGDAALLGVFSWSSIAAVAAEATVFTLANRTGHELIFGPPAGEDATSFWEEVFWNAAASVLLKGFHTVSKQFLGRPGMAAFRFRAPLLTRGITFGAEQLVMVGFSEYQQYARTGNFLSTGQAADSLIDQIAIAAVSKLGGHVMRPLAERLQLIDPLLDVNRATAVDASAAELGVLIDKVRQGVATPEERAGVPDAIERQWNTAIELILTLPEGDGRTALLAEFAQARAETELHLSLLGAETALAGPARPSFFAPAGPGVVAFAENAQPALEQYAATLPGANPLQPAALIDGALMLRMANGTAHTFMVPMAPLAIGPPKPSTVDEAANEAAVTTATVAFTNVGLQRLQGRFSELDCMNVLATAGDEGVADLLRLLSDPVFDNAPAPAISNAEVLGFAASGPACRFADLYSPELTVAILRLFGVSTFTPEVLGALDRAEKQIVAQPEAARDQFVADLLTRTPDGLRSWVNPPMSLAPLTPPAPAPVDVAGGGVDMTEESWAILRKKFAKNPAYTAAEVDALTAVEQVLARSKRRDFDALTEQQRLDILDKYRDLCASAPLDPALRLAKERELARWLFVSGWRKKPFYFLNRKRARPNRAGATEVLGRETRDGVKVNTLLVADRLDKITDAAAMDAALNAIEAMVNTAVANVDANERVEVQLVWSPDNTSYQTLVNRLKKPGSRVARMKNGLRDWTPIVEPAGAVRTDSKGRVIREEVERLANGRLPINAAYAGKVYDGDEWTKKLALKYAGGIRFTIFGFPIFAPWIYQHNGIRARVDFGTDGFGGNHDTDFTAVRQLYRIMLADPLWVEPADYTWHHSEDGRYMELVPTDLHDAVRHTGGVSLKK